MAFSGVSLACPYDEPVKRPRVSRRTRVGLAALIVLSPLVAVERCGRIPIWVSLLLVGQPARLGTTAHTRHPDERT
jgi:hypothetical protein